MINPDSVIIWMNLVFLSPFTRAHCCHMIYFTRHDDVVVGHISCSSSSCGSGISKSTTIRRNSVAAVIVVQIVMRAA